MDMKDVVVFLLGAALGYYAVSHYAKTGQTV